MQLLPLHGWTSALPLLLLLQSSASTTRTATPSSPSSWDLQQQQVSDCPSCVLARMRRGEVQGELEEEQAVVVEAVKKHILDALQLQSRPNVTRPLPHAALNNVLRRLHMVGEGGEGERTWGVWGGGEGGGGGAAGVAGGAGGDREATEIITFAEAGESPAELHFLLSAGGVRGEVDEPWVVEQAHVWLFLRLVKSNRNSSRCISSSSSRPIRNSSSSRCGSSSLSSSSSNSSSSSKVHSRVTVHLSSLPQGTPLGEKTVEVRRSSWHSFPLAVRGLLLHAAPLRLRVSCPLCAQAGVTPVLISSPTTITSASRGQQQLQQSHQPFLSAVVRPGRGDPAEGEQRSRSRRGAAEECEEGRRRQRGCCRRSLYVAFKDIGWSDWIIAPPGYQAHYCQGQCSLVGAAGAAGGAGSFHGAVLAHLRLRGSGPPGGLRSCCVPTRLRPLSLLYYDQEQNIIKRDVQDLVVEECGCS